MILPLLLYFSNKAVLPLVNQRGTKPLSKHSLSCNLTLPCKLLKFFYQNPWTKSGPGNFQFGILPRMPNWKSILFCNADLTLQVFQPFRIPIMIYRLTPYVSPKLFRFFSLWLIIITSFSFLIQFPVKLPQIILKHSALSTPIYHFLIPPNCSCNSNNALLQFFSSNTKFFYFNTVFSF